MSLLSKTSFVGIRFKQSLYPNTFSSDSSESLLSGSPAFAPAPETLGFEGGAGAAFFLALRALPSPTSSCSPIS
uniref:Uncharacterized protein n=1 Tax=Helianthus annuus TaxID=4232 RepID=A0A251VQ67_HELAN